MVVCNGSYCYCYGVFDLGDEVSQNPSKSEVCIEELRSVLSYNEETGIFTWKVSPRNGIECGAVAGAPHKEGYITITFKQKYYLAHRAAWAFVFDYWPSEQIDHINRCRSDNRICNLREATPKQNSENASLRKDNKSGYRGVRWYAQLNKWRAQISQNNKTVHLGLFDDKQEAHAAYVKAAAIYHTRNQASYSTQIEDKS